MAVKAIPDGFHSVTVYLSIRGAAEAIEFYKSAFGAVERYRLPGPDGDSVGHAEIQIGDSIIMLAEESPWSPCKSPTTLGGNTFGLCVYVENADASFERAVNAGATAMRPVQDQFYGDRSGTVVDPYGHMWTLATHIEDVSPEEMRQRIGVEYAKMDCGAAVNEQSAHSTGLA